MEEATYQVETTPEADHYYYALLTYFDLHLEPEKADENADELLILAESLYHHPYRGAKEPQLAFLGKGHRFLLYKYTYKKTIKIIYFVDEPEKKVFITDFFPTERDEEEISQRSS